MLIYQHKFGANGVDFVILESKVVPEAKLIDLIAQSFSVFTEKHDRWLVQIDGTSNLVSVEGRLERIITERLPRKLLKQAPDLRAEMFHSWDERFDCAEMQAALAQSVVLPINLRPLFEALVRASAPLAACGTLSWGIRGNVNAIPG